MGLTWEEVEASAQDRNSWRQRVALCIDDAGCIKVRVISIIARRYRGFHDRTTPVSQLNAFCENDRHKSHSWISDSVTAVFECRGKGVSPPPSDGVCLPTQGHSQVNKCGVDLIASAVLITWVWGHAWSRGRAAGQGPFGFWMPMDAANSPRSVYF